MERTKVVIITARSLFSEAIATRLRQHQNWIDLQVVDAASADALRQVIAARPAAVLLDASDPGTAGDTTLDRLLRALPTTRLIRLDPAHLRVQVVTSEERQARDVSELIDLIHPTAMAGRGLGTEKGVRPTTPTASEPKRKRPRGE